MAIIDPEGLFTGRRLRRCSPMARLHWPYLFLMANGFARIELDFDAIAYLFASFGAAAPPSAEIRGYFDEYRTNHLIFVYEIDGQCWGQWDTRRTWLKDFKTSADRKSPNPPEPEYRRWLEEQHGGDWSPYHWNKLVEEGPVQSLGNTAQRVEDSPNTSLALNRKLPKPLSSVGQDLPLGGGVGVGDGNGVGEVGGNSLPNAALYSDTERTPDVLPPSALAMHLVSMLGIPIYPALLMAVSDAIRIKAETDGIGSAAAHDELLRRAALVKKEGPPKSWLFFFRDGLYDRKTKQEVNHEWLQRHSDPS